MSARQKLKAETVKAEINEGVVGLTKKQVAGALQISERTLSGMMARGEISYWKIGRLVRFRMEDAVKRMNETVLVKGDEGSEVRRQRTEGSGEKG